MTANITLADAIDRLIESTRLGLARTHEGGTFDGDPFDVPAEGRVNIFRPTGTVSVDFPTDDEDGFTTDVLGLSGWLHTEASEAGDLALVAWIDILRREPVRFDLLGLAFGVPDEEIVEAHEALGYGVDADDDLIPASEALEVLDYALDPED